MEDCWTKTSKVMHFVSTYSKQAEEDWVPDDLLVSGVIIRTQDGVCLLLVDASVTLTQFLPFI